MHFRATILLSSLAALGAAVPVPSGHVEHEARSILPRGWIKTDAVDESIVMPVRIGMTQGNLEGGANVLYDISHPESPNYGKHWTAQEIHDFFAPSESSVSKIRSWLESAGIANDRVSQSVNKQWLQFDATAPELEALLHTKYHVYEEANGQRHVSCDSYHVPAHVSEHVDFITPGVKSLKLRTTSASLLKNRSLRKRSSHFKPQPKIKPLSIPIEQLIQEQAAAATCNTQVTPACIRTFYNITAPTTSVAGNNLGIFEDLGDIYSQTDLNDFFAAFATNIPQGTHPTLDAVDGAVAPTTVSNAGAESDLDFQISYPIIYPQGETLFQTDDPVYESNYDFVGFFNTFLDAIDGSYCNYTAFGESGINNPYDPVYPDPASGGYKGQLQCGVYSPTNVISISYGSQESDQPTAYQERQCNEYMKLGLQGVSILIASGDSGVGVRSGECLGSTGKVFSPDNPATCPYVTAVGATTLPAGASAAADAETAVTQFGSGGGFSNIYPIPSYQSTAVKGYLTNHPPPYKSYSTTNNTNVGANGGLYNSNGRAYPDVAAVGQNIVIYNAGEAVSIGGTSASTPLWGGILTRINGLRLAAGKTTIGFVNPTLYANPSALHDITVGTNPGCGSKGFSASTGWDPVTGLGTPNFPALVSVFTALP